MIWCDCWALRDGVRVRIYARVDASTHHTARALVPSHLDGRRVNHAACLFFSRPRPAGPSRQAIPTRDHLRAVMSTDSRPRGTVIERQQKKALTPLVSAQSRASSRPHRNYCSIIIYGSSAAPRPLYRLLYPNRGIDRAFSDRPPESVYNNNNSKCSTILMWQNNIVRIE
jgi:hypothetical protein